MEFVLKTGLLLSLLLYSLSLTLSHTCFGDWTSVQIISVVAVVVV